ncbi:glycoside hydrolase family 28 protein [Paenibacillus odorifer]|uniref:glycoside hydrolase family 28 protein n=1 Tax=Paenibacillus TaxID=44249 RepID=UPI00096D5AD1|nr:glycoside hydrolase family 28 protein [Paenibacillus odorifer]OMD04221.1 endopolygalacturonase [Paenibacillus odorifer]OMD16853.1 endopolygalacturonase [Paenibacillus odorifer]OMD27353.1 endopolygalacturonase [Paenibacillus odorifer]OME25342.1 endopolygalacturonase [Paenibacillus odorifer]OME43088.1 endopolygalacturonase [Paenibacillus odorifer]
MSIYNINDYGAHPNSAEPSTEAIARAIHAASEAGGGTVYVPSGHYQTGAIFMKSNIELQLSPGAELSFSSDPNDYPVVSSRWEGVKQNVHASCIFGINLENVSVTGAGKLDGRGAPWWDKHRNSPDSLLYPRPKLISFDNCRRVTLRDLTLVNSPSWTVNPICCQDVTIDNLSIYNPADSPNTDGIDPESCVNVRISNCNIDVGDDCIAIKAGTEDTKERVACENITITNCTMIHGHGGVVLGSEMSGDIRNIVISNCVFKQTDRGIRLKSRRGRGGVVEDIRVSNIVMEDVICPFILNLYYFCGPRGKDKYVWDKNPYPVTEETPCFRRIHFANITARNVHAAAGFLYGLAEQYISEITFSDIDISMAENAIPGRPAMMSGIQDMNNRGFYLGNVRDIRFRQVTIENHEGPAFYIENGETVDITGCQSRNTRKVEELVQQVTVIPSQEDLSEQTD